MHLPGQGSGNVIRIGSALTMHFLEQLSLRGFRSTNELDNFTLGPVTVFVGANGSGKSNFIGFFRLMNHVMHGGLQQFLDYGGHASNFLHFGPARTRFLNATVKFRSDAGLNTYHCELAFAAVDRLIFVPPQQNLWVSPGRRVRKRPGFRPRSAWKCMPTSGDHTIPLSGMPLQSMVQSEKLIIIHAPRTCAQGHPRSPSH